MKIYKKLAGQTVIYGLGTVVPRLLNYSILTVYYTRLFSVEQFGVITELYAYVTFLLVILTFGTETGYFRFSQEGKEDSVFSSITAFLLFTSLFFGFVVFTNYERIADWLSYSGNTQYILLMGSIIAVDAFSTIGFSKLRKEERAYRFMWLKIINVVATVILVVLFYQILPWFVSDNPASVFYNSSESVTFVLISNLIASVIIMLLLLPEYLRTRLIFDFRLLKQVLAYSFPLVISGLAGYINETLDKILLKHLLPQNGNELYELGIYGANYKIATLLLIVIQMFRFALEPFYFNYFREKDAKELFSQIMRLFIVVCIMVGMVIIFYLDLIKFFIDPKFHEGLRIIPVILAAYLFYGIFFNLSIWYKLTKKTMFAVYLTGTGAAITLVINFVFVPRFSYMASAYGHLASYAVMVFLSYIVGRRFYRIDYKLARIFEYITVALLIFTVFYLLDELRPVYQYALNAFLILGYAGYVLKREKLLSIFRKKYESKDR